MRLKGCFGGCFAKAVIAVLALWTLAVCAPASAARSAPASTREDFAAVCETMIRTANETIGDKAASTCAVDFKNEEVFVRLSERKRLDEDEHDNFIGLTLGLFGAAVSDGLYSRSAIVFVGRNPWTKKCLMLDGARASALADAIGAAKKPLIAHRKTGELIGSARPVDCPEAFFGR